MTLEEFKKLPYCLAYKDPGASDGCPCHPNNDDDWDELEDPCDGCCWNKYVYEKSHNIELESYKDLLASII